ncbi:hypothetical protein DIPPA_09935 [Diplonema papillatum]|nr:hypothetical protein DIPPA_09935 [Diplonema papillatum]
MDNPCQICASQKTEWGSLSASEMKARVDEEKKQGNLLVHVMLKREKQCKTYAVRINAIVLGLVDQLRRWQGIHDTPTMMRVFHNDQLLSPRTPFQTLRFDAKADECIYLHCQVEPTYGW